MKIREQVYGAFRPGVVGSMFGLCLTMERCSHAPPDLTSKTAVELNWFRLWLGTDAWSKSSGCQGAICTLLPSRASPCGFRLGKPLPGATLGGVVSKEMDGSWLSHRYSRTSALSAQSDSYLTQHS